MLLHRILAHASSTPDQLAVVCGVERIGYRQLAESVIDLAGRLARAGVREGDGVVMQLPNGIPFVTSFLAIAALRGIAVPLSTSTAPQEMGRHLRGCRATATLTQAPFAKNHAQGGGDALPPVLLLERLPEPSGWSPAAPHAGPVLCQYSSGSTGQPKCCIRTQRDLLLGCDSLAAAAAVGKDDAILCAIPLAHSHGLTNCLILALCSGAKLVILESRPVADDGKELPLPLRRRELMEILAGELVSIVPGVPFLFSLIANGSNDYARFPALRLCFSAGSPLTKETYARFGQRFGLSLRQLYGTTETGAVSINLAADIDDSWDSVGQPLPGCEIQVDGRAEGVAEGEVGIRSSGMCVEYPDQPELTTHHFSAGWFRPGDLARRDASGKLRLIGRVRPFIVSAGHKIDPTEVEAVLRSHPAVAEVVVIGAPNLVVGELVQAYVVAEKYAEVSEVELTELCRRRLDSYKVPKHFTFLDQLPRTALGKPAIHLLSTPGAGRDAQ